MEMPGNLQLMVERLLKEIRDNVLFQIEPSQRKTIYAFFTERNVYGWLAIITARFVLPIFEESVDDSYLENMIKEDENILLILPQNLLRLAERALKGEVNRGWANHIAAEAHNFVWRYAKPDVSEAVDLAAITAQRALSECLSGSPFINTHRFYGVTSAGDLINGVNFQDIELAIIGGDTASSAAIAYAGGIDRIGTQERVHNLESLHHFWEWWLAEAIPQAWAMIVDAQ